MRAVRWHSGGIVHVLGVGLVSRLGSRTRSRRQMVLQTANLRIARMASFHLQQLMGKLGGVSLSNWGHTHNSHIYVQRNERWYRWG